jgi:carboxylate-amine ligase
VPDWVIDGSPELRPSGALVSRPGVRAQVAGVDLVRDGDGNWCVLEDNLRVPSGIGYAMQNRRLTEAVLPELPRPDRTCSASRALRPCSRRRCWTRPAGRRRTIRRSWCSARARTTRPGSSTGCSPRRWASRWSAAPELFVDHDRVFRMQHGSRHPVDVIYLRMGEDSLVHSPGADGMPLGPSLVSALHADTIALANALGQRHRGRQGGCTPTCPS